MGSWPVNRGLPPNCCYETYDWGYGCYAPGRAQGWGIQVVAKDSGRVFFGRHYPYYDGGNASQATTGSFATGPSYRTSWQDHGAHGRQVHGFDAEIGGLMQTLGGGSLGGDTTYRSICLVEVTNTGQQVAFVCSGTSTSRYATDEIIGYVGSIQNGPNGALETTPFVQVLEGSPGRAGEAMAHDFTGTKLFYAFGPTSNENQKEVKEAVFDTSGGSVSTREVNGSTLRYTVLYAGR